MISQADARRLAHELVELLAIRGGPDTAPLSDELAALDAVDLVVVLVATGELAAAAVTKLAELSGDPLEAELAAFRWSDDPP